MANSVTEEDKKLVYAIHRAGLLDKLQQLFERRLVIVEKQLRVSNGEVLYRAQGKAQELDELLESLKIQRST